VSATPSTADVIVIGAGHNGLACAWKLAQAGRKVTVLEARDEVGGAAATREFAPGHRVSACAHLLRAFPAELMAAMNLPAHGLKLAAQALPTYALVAGRPALHLGAADVASAAAAYGVSASVGQAAEQPAAADARYQAFRQRLVRYAEVVRTLMGQTPPSLALDQWPDRINLLKLGWRVRSLGRDDMRDLLRIAGMNVYDLLDDNIDAVALKGALAFDAVLGAEHGPRAPGTVLTWLLHLAGQAQAGATGLAQPVGGIGALTRAMASAASAAGVTVRTGAKVERILVESDRACGVQLVSGETLAAGTVISNADPRTTFLKLLGPAHLDTEFVRRIQHHRASGRVAKLHLALDGAPRFSGLPPDALGARLLISPSMDAVENAFNPSKYRELPSAPVMEITVPTVHDASLAPAGRHVLSALVQFVPYDLGPDPAATRQTLMNNVMAVLDAHAPGLSAQVRASELLTPLDLERAFGMTGGHWHHGAMSFDQFFFNRPVPGAGRYTTPLDGLVLCGAGSHPGGGLMGTAGLNAARTVLAAKAPA
jgi:phytoene dehydrogenase-like protein